LEKRKLTGGPGLSAGEERGRRKVAGWVAAQERERGRGGGRLGRAGREQKGEKKDKKIK